MYQDPTRRRLLCHGLALLAGASPLLQACGGGGGEGGGSVPAPAPGYAPLAAPFAVSLHAAVTTLDGGVLVLGGSRGQGVVSDALDLYNPATRSFARIGSLLTGRAEHSATRLADGRVLVLGGSTGLQIGNIAELVDPRSGAVAAAGALQQPRARHATVALADGRVLTLGGINRRSAELWDPAGQRWRLLAAPMACSREFATATLLGDGRVLIVGGSSGDADYQFAELFDPVSERFTVLDSGIRQRRSLHEAQRLADGSVLILGGEADGAALATVLRYMPAQQRLREEPALAGTRTLARSVLLGAGAEERVLLFGGQQTLQAEHSAGAEAYRPGTGGSALTAMPEPRAWHSVSRLPDGGVLIVGGERADGSYVSQALVYR